MPAVSLQTESYRNRQAKDAMLCCVKSKCEMYCAVNAQHRKRTGPQQTKGPLGKWREDFMKSHRHCYVLRALSARACSGREVQNDHASINRSRGLVICPHTTELCKNTPAKFLESHSKCFAEHPKIALWRNIPGNRSQNLARKSFTTLYTSYGLTLQDLSVRINHYGTDHVGSLCIFADMSWHGCGENNGLRRGTNDMTLVLGIGSPMDFPEV